MSRPRHPFSRPSCDQKERPAPADRALGFTRIALDPLIWPLTAQSAGAPPRPAAFTRWFRRLIRPRE